LYLPFEPIRRTGCLRLEPLLLALPVACAAIAQALPCVQRCTAEAAAPKQRGKEEHPTRTTSTCARTENRPRKRKTAPPQTQHEEITEITRIEIESTAQRARGGEGLLSHRFAVPGLKDP